MTTRRGLFGLFAGAAATVAAKPVLAAGLLDAQDAVYNHNLFMAEMPSHHHSFVSDMQAAQSELNSVTSSRLIQFNREVTRDYIRQNLFNPFEERG